MNVYGELISAQLENTTDPSSKALVGRVYWNTSEARVKYTDGTLARALLGNDQKCVFGNNATAANNLRWNRSANATMELLTGDDTTAEGSSNPTKWATLSCKLGTPVFTSYYDITETTTPSNPASTIHRVYFKSDGLLYKLDSSGNEAIIGGTSPGVNYILNPDAETGTSGWATYADAAATTPVDGTGGSPTCTWTRVTSSPLRGAGMFRLTKDAANRQGDGVGYAFTIAAADKAKPINISFEYTLSAAGVSGSDSATGDINVYVYDITNALLIQPAPFKLPGGTGNNWKYSGTFQTASNSTSYRLILHVAGTNASAATYDFDNFIVGPQIQLYGSPISEWTSFTPTGSWVSNTTYTGFWRRVGGDIECQVKVALAGAPTSANLTVNLPSGLSWDTTRMVQDDNSTAAWTNATGKQGGGGFKFYTVYNSTTGVLVAYQSSIAAAGSAVTQAAPVTWANGDFIIVTFRGPIVGWLSNVLMSNDTDTRVVAAKAYRNSSGQTMGTSATEAVFQVTRFDTHGAYGTSTGRFTAPVSGYYRASYCLDITMGGTAATSVSSYVQKNGTGDLLAVCTQNSLTNSKDYSFSASTVIQLIAGDYISVWVSSVGQTVTMTNSGGTNDTSSFSVERLTGPSAIAISELVACRYTNTAGSTLTKSTGNTVPFATKDFDSHGAFVTDTFTAPTPGKYSVKAVLNIATGATWASGDFIYLEIQKNGSTHTGGNVTIFFGTFVGAIGAQIVGTVNCIAGDTIKISCNPTKAAASNVTLNTTAGYNAIAIERIGP